MPLAGLLIYAALFALIGFGGGGDYNATAANNAQACRNSLEGYFAQQRTFPATAEELASAGCRGSQQTALFVLPQNNHYVIVSYHHNGDKAYLHSRNTLEVQELDKGAAAAELSAAFKVVGEVAGVTLISQ